MTTPSVDLITISRQFGAGGSELAHALGERLGWHVYDRELVRDVATRIGLDESAAAELAERPPQWLHRLAAMLMLAPPDAPVIIEHERVLDVDAIAAAATAAIAAAARSAPAIVVGHGGQFIFRHRPATMHIRVVAPLPDRLRRVCRRFGCDERNASAQVARVDEGRSQYLRRYHHGDWNDPLLYDLQINTGRLPTATAAEMIAELIGSAVSAPVGSP